MPSEASWLALARANPPTIRTPLTDRTHRSCRRAAAGGCSGAPRVSGFSMCLSHVGLSVALTAGRSAVCWTPARKAARRHVCARAGSLRMQPDAAGWLHAQRLHARMARLERRPLSEPAQAATRHLQAPATPPGTPQACPQWRISRWAEPATVGRSRRGGHMRAGREGLVAGFRVCTASFAAAQWSD